MLGPAGLNATLYRSGASTGLAEGLVDNAGYLALFNATAGERPSSWLACACVIALRLGWQRAADVRVCLPAGRPAGLGSCRLPPPTAIPVLFPPRSAPHAGQATPLYVPLSLNASVAPNNEGGLYTDRFAELERAAGAWRGLGAGCRAAQAPSRRACMRLTRPAWVRGLAAAPVLLLAPPTHPAT